MVTIVDSDQKYQSAKKTLEDCKKPVLVPIWMEEEEHPMETELSLIFFFAPNIDKSFVFPLCHVESINSYNFDFDIPKEVFVLDKKKLIQDSDFRVDQGQLISLDLIYWFLKNEKLEFQKLPTYFNTFPKSGSFVNSSHIPLYHISDFLEKKIENLFSLIENEEIIKLDSFQNYDDKVIPVFSKIELNGLSIDDKKFNEVFQNKINRNFESFVYTDYETFTSTGRPSNSNYNINFAALDPSENQKEPFVSRFGEDGILLQFDYDAFHLRLIGNLIDYELPDESFHSYLGKKYYDKESLSPREYEEAKKITFRFLYGEDIEEARNVEFFDRTFDFRDELWDAFKEEGFLLTPKFHRRIPEENISEVNPGKAFSYLLQSYETEFNVSILDKLFDFLNSYKSEVVLYTYDAFLFDFCFDDGKELLKELKNRMEVEQMKVKASVGKNFGDMREVEM